MPARCVFEAAGGARCPHAAVFYNTEGKRRWCEAHAPHAPEKTTRTKPRRVCEVCAATATCGKPPTRCADHATSPYASCEDCRAAPATTVLHVVWRGRAGATLCDACARDALRESQGSDRAWKPTCTHVDADGTRCATVRSYGFEYGVPLFCATHRRPGTVNVRTKPRCQVHECSQPAEYGDASSRWCKAHAPPNMTRCAYLVCEALGCTRHATHALRGDAFSKQLRWCDAHAPSSARLVFHCT